MQGLKETDVYLSAILMEDEEGKEYFFKGKLEENVIRELLAQEIAKRVNLDHVIYSRYRFNGEDGVISESFFEDGYKYIEGDNLIWHYISRTMKTNPSYLYDKKDEYGEIILKDGQDLYIIWQAMEQRFKHYPNYEEQIVAFMDDLIYMMFFDLLIVNGDRKPYNWSIKYDEITFGLVKIYDNDLSFGARMGSKLNTSQEALTNEQALTEFLEQSDDLVAEGAYDFFNIVTPENISEILEYVLKEHNFTLDEDDKKDLINTFNSNYRELMEVINKRIKGVKK